MNTQQITAIAFRLLALWLLIQIFLNLSTLAILFVNLEQHREKETTATAYAILVGVIVFVGLLAVFFINKAASSVLERAKADSGTWLSSDSQLLLFQLGGLYFVVNSLAHLPRSLSIILSEHQPTLMSVFAISGEVLQLGVGLWLVTGAKYWYGIFVKFRIRA